MSATEREIRLRIVATDTHCGDGGAQCIGSGPEFDECLLFAAARTWDEKHGASLRLPECIAAEKGNSDAV